MAEGLLNTEAEQEELREPGALALSEDDFSALEERVLRAVSVVRRERQARAEAEERASHAEARVAQAELKQTEHSQHTQQLENDVKQLRAEREHVRQRVDKLLKQLDSIEA